MYLFTRRGVVRAGNPGDAVAWSIGITEKVRQITGLDVSLWRGTLGGELGATAWSVIVPDLVSLEAAEDKLAADSGYLDEAARGQQFIPDGVQDQLRQFVHPQIDASAPPPEGPQATYVAVVESSIAEGSTARALEVGVAIAQRAEQITGVATAFLMNATGVFTGVTWITAHTDIQAIEAANNAMASDPEWLQMLDRETAGVFAADPAATTQLLYRRVL